MFSLLLSVAVQAPSPTPLEEVSKFLLSSAGIVLPAHLTPPPPISRPIDCKSYLRLAAQRERPGTSLEPGDCVNFHGVTPIFSGATAVARLRVARGDGNCRD